MKKILLPALLLFIGAISYAQDDTESALSETKSTGSGSSSRTAKKNKKNKTYLLQSQPYQRTAAMLPEGYHSSPNGFYSIKNYLIKGGVNLVCVTYGVSISSDYINRGSSVKKYYLLKDNDRDTYREVFLAKSSQGSMLEMSKAILTDVLKNDPETIKKVSELKKIRAADLKRIVKLYNAKLR